MHNATEEAIDGEMSNVPTQKVKTFKANWVYYSAIYFKQCYNNIIKLLH